MENIPEELRQKSKTLTPAEIGGLVSDLDTADDNIRYNAFLLLISRSEEFGDVYPYCAALAKKMESSNSYQRTIGFKLLSVNSKWDKDNVIEKNLGLYLGLLNDEKPITSRVCIQALNYIIPFKKGLLKEISEKLMSIDLMQVKETMRKLILSDILRALIEIKKYGEAQKINAYILSALSGGILDPKLKKQFMPFST